MAKVWAKVSPLVRRSADDRGASLVEYALLIALIAVLCIASVTLLAGGVSDSLSNVGQSLN